MSRYLNECVLVALNLIYVKSFGPEQLRTKAEHFSLMLQKNFEKNSTNPFDSALKAMCAAPALIWVSTFCVFFVANFFQQFWWSWNLFILFNLYLQNKNTPSGCLKKIHSCFSVNDYRFYAPNAWKRTSHPEMFDFVSPRLY